MIREIPQGLSLGASPLLALASRLADHLLESLLLYPRLSQKQTERMPGVQCTEQALVYSSLRLIAFRPTEQLSQLLKRKGLHHMQV